MAGEDFVHIRLTAAGRSYVAAQGGATLRVTDGTREFIFSATDDADDVRVSRAFEWEKWLRAMVVPGSQGEPFFEIGPETRAAAE